MLVFHTETSDETQDIGKAIGRLLKPGDLISLVGEMGAGKTTLVQGIAQGLESTEHVTSPTFTLINEYPGRIPLYHFDVYRLQSSEDMEDLGYEEYFQGTGATLIEWADRIESLLPDERLDIYLEWENEGRKMTLVPHGIRYQEMLTELKKDADSRN
jgi:tRNA threonylcarbamoyladenosine biosynthesis protein TsaE